MVAQFERGILQRYITSASTQQRHQSKLLSLLDWIYRFQFTSTSVIEELWGLDRSTINRMLRRYLREELIAEVPTFCCRDKRLFFLKTAGLKVLEQFHNESLKYNGKPSTLNFKTCTHDLMVQALVAKGCFEGKYKFYITEREQTKEGLQRKRRFDAIVFEVESAELVAIEVEASAKTIPSRLGILQSTYRAITDENRVSRVLYFSHKRRYLTDAARIHQKLFDRPENHLNEAWFKEHLKIVYSREVMDLLYHKFWLH